MSGEDKAREGCDHGGGWIRVTGATRPILKLPYERCPRCGDARSIATAIEALKDQK